MTIYNNLIIILSLAVFISYLNYRFIKVPPTIAIMTTALLLSIVLLVLDKLGFHMIHNDVTNFVSKLHFEHILVGCMLGLLLFAGALSIDISRLREQKWEIGILATVSVIASMFIIGTTLYYLLPLFGLPFPFIYCLLFGAIISPTDPIAVLGIFKQIRVPKKLEMMLAAESLFNDGVAVVLFITLYHIAFSNEPTSFGYVALLFLYKTIGGVLFGLILSYLAYLLMKPIDNYKMEILLTLAFATGGYTLAQSVGLSGPLAIVTLGIYIASRKHEIVISKQTREQLENFWELIDELLNAILFLLIGFEILVVPFTFWEVIAVLTIIPVVLLTRAVTVSGPMLFMKRLRRYPVYTVRIMTWGGLRGGLAIALALAVPKGIARDVILPMTYGVVLFSVLVQGSTIKPLAKKSRPRKIKN